MENKLENICAFKIQAERTAYPNSELEKCRNCGGYNEDCLNFIEIKRTQIPYRKGKFAVLETR